MGQMTNKLDKVLAVFYENPGKRFTVRDIAKKTKIPKSSVSNYINELKKNGLILDSTGSNSLLFKIKKTNFYIEKMVEIGLVDHIVEKLNPSCIILFGSFRKGESDKDSDIDIFIESNKKDIDLTKFERKLNHKIQLFIEDDIHKLPDRLFNNVVNGIKLWGSFKVK